MRLREGRVPDPGGGKAEEDPVVISFLSAVRDLENKENQSRKKNKADVDASSLNVAPRGQGLPCKPRQGDQEEDLGHDGEESRRRQDEQISIVLDVPAALGCLMLADELSDPIPQHRIVACMLE